MYWIRTLTLYIWINNKIVTYMNGNCATATIRGQSYLNVIKIKFIIKLVVIDIGIRHLCVGLFRNKAQTTVIVWIYINSTHDYSLEAGRKVINPTETTIFNILFNSIGPGEWRAAFFLSETIFDWFRILINPIEIISRYISVVLCESGLVTHSLVNMCWYNTCRSWRRGSTKPNKIELNATSARRSPVHPYQHPWSHHAHAHAPPLPSAHTRNDDDNDPFWVY